MNIDLEAILRVVGLRKQLEDLTMVGLTARPSLRSDDMIG